MEQTIQVQEYHEPLPLNLTDFTEWTLKYPVDDGLDYNEAFSTFAMWCRIITKARNQGE